MLKCFVHDRSKKSDGSIKGDVKQMRSELAKLNKFLEEASKVEYEDEELTNHVTRVKDVTGSIDDVLGDYDEAVEQQLHVPKERSLNKILTTICCTSKQIDNFSSVISKIAKIKKDTKSIHEAAKSQRITERIQQMLDEDNLRRLKRSFNNHGLEEVYIEIKDDIEAVLEMLIRPGGDPFVSIFGLAGSGKTTIAKKVYEREEIKRGFECFAWIDIIQESEEEGEIILRDLVKMLMEGASSKELSDTPSDNLQYLLEHNRCLIVLDDVQSYYELGFLLRDVPRAKNSMSKVLITTRVQRIADIGRFHVPRSWTQTESWELLYKISIIDTPDAETDIETKRKLEHTGRQIVDKCDRLPSAVANIGGILRTTPTSSNEWEKVLERIYKHLSVGGGSLEDSFIRSYNSLPFRLKLCFLYMAMFQKDEPIEATRLSHLWITEGLVSKEDCSSNETLMDVAQRNLHQLASRGMNMLEVVRRNEANKHIEWCKVHTWKKDLLHKKAKKEGFFETLKSHASDGKGQIKDQLSFNKKARRLVMQSGGSQYPDLNEMQSVRVLIVSSDSDFSAIDTVRKFKYLKVIEFDGCRFPNKHLPKEIFNIHLRYILLNPTHDIELPLDAPAFQYIQTLNLLASHAIYVPDILWKMKRLKHLYLGYGCCPLASEKLKLQGLNELEILDIRKGGIVKLEDLPGLINLQFLGINIDTDDLPDGKQYISAMIQPKWVRIATEVPVDYISDDAPHRLRRVLEFDQVNELVIKGSFELPVYENVFWPNVSRLTIEQTLIEGDPMKLLKHLPKLKELRLEDDEFMTDEIECDANAFPQLVTLKLKWCLHLKKWRVDKTAFPKLSSLTIVGCRDLEEIVPEEGLRNLQSLKVVDFIQMPEEFEKYRL